MAQGATTQAIADKAGLSKAQLHYYIESKDALYRQVLLDIIDDWIGVFGFCRRGLRRRAGCLSDLIRRKMLFSFEQQLRSRIFAAEMMRGAPVLRPMMELQSKRRTEQAGGRHPQLDERGADRAGRSAASSSSTSGR